MDKGGEEGEVTKSSLIGGPGLEKGWWLAGPQWTQVKWMGPLQLKQLPGTAGLGWTGLDWGLGWAELPLGFI